MVNKKTNKYSEKMVLLNSGKFHTGTNDSVGYPADGEGPVREVSVDSFYIDTYTVTNQEFSEFVEDTGYQTDAENFGSSFVFEKLLADINSAHIQQVSRLQWWYQVEGASWKHPEGPGSTIKHRLDHPVVHVTWNDAVAFCAWAGKRLPTEKEWEYAARGGLEKKKYPWGNEFMLNGTYQCNTWQGVFPDNNTQDDGYLGTAPAKSYKPNGYELYNMVGNVWEWCANPFYPIKEAISQSQENRAMRGGSFLCHKSYCNRYRVAARNSNTASSSTSNIGFRCVRSYYE